MRRRGTRDLCGRNGRSEMVTATMGALQEEFTGHVRAGLFDSVERTLTNEVEAEDRMAEGIGWAWHEYQRRADRGEGTDPALLHHICRLRAQDIGRQLHTDGTWRIRDAYDRRAYRDGNVELLRLGGIRDDGNEDEEETLVEASVGRQAPQEDWIVSRIDLEAWLSELAADERKILLGRLSGFTLKEIGKELRQSVFQVCRKAKALGRELAIRAGIEVDMSDNRGRRRSPAPAS